MFATQTGLTLAVLLANLQVLSPSDAEYTHPAD